MSYKGWGISNRHRDYAILVLNIFCSQSVTKDLLNIFNCFIVGNYAGLLQHTRMTSFFKVMFAHIFAAARCLAEIRSS